MDVFHKLTEPNLQLLSLQYIKHIEERKYALKIITLGCPSATFENLLLETSKSKELVISKNDVIGLMFTFVLEKQNGNIQVSLNRKRKNRLIVSFCDDRLGRKKIVELDHSCDDMWVKILIYEFDKSIIQYIREGFSGKIKKLKKLIADLINKSVNISVYIDIPGHIIII